MTLSLALAFFLAATLGADAAPAKSKTTPRAGQLAQTVTVSGECTRLVQAGQPVAGCKNILVNTNYSTGVSGYWFMTGNSIVSFAGDGARRLEQASGHVIQSIERVFLTDTAKPAQEEDATEETAIGFCRFSDMTERGSTIECVAHTRAGLYEGAFVTDGNPPKLDTFQLGR
ncbi:hypothetical protein [Microvirga lotononidis]|uniref:Integral membrane protein n=1 Tax=Microvirga lotononidis TaxID=864069 RepID=I4Z3U5_9HYPH|nr:hypothetical protein [Microvirga lotononidis]EIM30153.1 hypothetical protein MicloDRAFT_00014740 [Microvirga lotononidis]EIM30887.1 hypothetical protein MicloDRAFT_00004140 [Microvirga lotononidis]WQO31813.1 hypothetical protein U0023_31170 [Microvirga lotononidis]